MKRMLKLTVKQTGKRKDLTDLKGALKNED